REPFAAGAATATPAVAPPAGAEAETAAGGEPVPANSCALLAALTGAGVGLTAAPPGYRLRSGVLGRWEQREAPPQGLFAVEFLKPWQPRRSLERRRLRWDSRQPPALRLGSTPNLPATWWPWAHPRFRRRLMRGGAAPVVLAALGAVASAVSGWADMVHN
ncbi:hypothetical protein GGX14DRAFT_468642, partial [Mycena pura]